MPRTFSDFLDSLLCMQVRQPHNAREGEETSGGDVARSGAQAAYNARHPRRHRPPREDRRALNPSNGYYHYEGGNPESQMVVGRQHISSFTYPRQLPDIPDNHGIPPNGTSLTTRHFQPDSRLPIAREFMSATVPPEEAYLGGSEAYQFNEQAANLDEGQAIERIYQALCHLRIEVPSTHFTMEITRNPFSIEMGINDVISAYKSVCSGTKQLGDRVTTLDTDREPFQPTSEDELNRKDQKISELNEEAKELNEEVQKLRTKVEEKNNQNLILTGQVRVLTEGEQKYEARESRIRGDHQRDRDALVKLVEAESKARQDLQQAQAFYTATENQLQKEKDDIEQFFNNQTKLSETKHQNERLAWERNMQLAKGRFEQQINQHEKDSLRKITDIGKKHESEKREMIRDLLQTKEGVKQQITQFEQQRHTMETEHKAEIVKMRANCEAEKIAHVRGLKETVEMLKMELSRRDHFKAMSDRELANRFKEIANEVDDFSRYPWEKDRESSWPFPLRVILKSEKNERVTKQEIMQNTLWVILYKKIFCTPFRVLGEKGKALELEWVHQDEGSNGPATLCPRPTKASEKWRYETMKECVEAITEPGIVVKANRNVKEGYELTLKEITDALSHELARVALVDTNEKQRIGLLVTKAAQLWLEVGQQRSRMYLLMSNSGHEPAQSSPTSLNRDGRMELVVIPEVRRRGNVKGDRLDEDELVSDCKGEFSIFPQR